MGLNRQINAKHSTKRRQQTEEDWDLRSLSMPRSEGNETTAERLFTSPDVLTSTPCFASSDMPLGNEYSMGVNTLFIRECEDLINLDYMCLDSSRADLSLSPPSSPSPPRGSAFDGNVQTEVLCGVEGMWQLTPVVSEYDSFLQEPLIFTG